MIVTLLVCGKLKPGPETELVRDYMDRAKILGRQLGITDVRCKEVAIANGTSPKTASEMALRGAAQAEIKIMLDETGKQMRSDQFASKVNSWRERGVSEVCLMVGPADGWTDASRTQADLLLGFGQLTWPHKLAQAMAAEQTYRALSILAGTPYHRGNG